MTVEKSIQTLQELIHVHLKHSEGMKEFASKPGRTVDMKEIGLMISQNHYNMAEVLKTVIEDLRFEQKAIHKKLRRRKQSKKLS